MSDIDRKAHWQHVYATKTEKEVSWFQESPTPSLDLIIDAGLSTDAAIVDVGGGTSRLVDSLIQAGFRQITVLDISANALEKTKKRLGRSGDAVAWITADITRWKPNVTYDLWHDRANFSFFDRIHRPRSIR